MPSCLWLCLDEGRHFVSQDLPLPSTVGPLGLSPWWRRCNSLAQLSSAASLPVPGLPECSPEEGLLSEEPVAGTLRDFHQPAGSEQPHPAAPWWIHHSALHLWSEPGSRLRLARLHREAVRHRVSLWSLGRYADVAVLVVRDTSQPVKPVSERFLCFCSVNFLGYQ